MKYVGLTDDPEERKGAHGDPGDWWQRSFETEKEARAWEKGMLAKTGYKGGRGGKGWKYELHIHDHGGYRGVSTVANPFPPGPQL